MRLGEAERKDEKMQEDVTFTEEGRELFAHLKREIDHHTSRRIRERIDARLFRSRPEALILDFCEVSFMDSSGIGLILGRVETCRAVGCTVRLTGLSPTLMKLIRLSGIDKVRDLSVMR